jgi:hypothetical protein
MAFRAARLLVVPVVVLLVAGCGGDATPPAKPSAAASAHAGHATFTSPPSSPLRAGERFQTLAMPRAYTPDPPAAGGTDDYRCFLVDPGLSRRTILVGSQFLPQNADIVHHAIFFRVAPVDVPEARQLDTASPGDGWTCFGGSGITGRRSGASVFGGASWIASWAPGVGSGSRRRAPASSSSPARRS